MSTCFDVSHLPLATREHVVSQLANLETRLVEEQLWDNFLGLPEKLHQQLVTVLVASDFVAEQLCRKPQLLFDLVQTDLVKDNSASGNASDEYGQRLEQALATVTTDKQAQRVLRGFRQREMVRLIWRDVTEHPQFKVTVKELSALADACIDTALQWLYQYLAPRWGRAYYPKTEQWMPMVVIGMGKLGACELNLSSDIDLMFAYSAEGETRGGKKNLAHRDYFTRLGQQLIKLLDESTVDGFVFRVDMRLRPYGNSGALALNFLAMERYYEEQGREWERYAMIKARAIGASREDGARLLQSLQPFIYRRYVDFGVIESLRGLKKLINQEVVRRGNEDNIKIGAGGIRDIEFIAQVFQLIRGGQDQDLRVRNLLQALQVIQQLELLPNEIVKELSADYVFLRNVEHRLQALRDRQTQVLPQDELDRERIAFGLGYIDWAQFYEALEQVRRRVRVHFNALIEDPEEQVDTDIDPRLVGIWLAQQADSEDAESALSDLGFVQLDSSWSRLQALRQSSGVNLLQEVPRGRLDRLMPMLISACANQNQPDVALARVLELVEAILRRSAYMALLTENPEALQRLAMLFTASPWVADTITRFPILLDDLLNEATLFTPPDSQELEHELRQRVLRIPADDLEQQMLALRHFQHSHLLRVAASELMGTLPLMRVSDYLSGLAETLLQTVLHMAWDQMVDKYGRPAGSQGNASCQESADSQLNFIIVGYGKLGGIELNYSSDLDLVFIHDAASTGMTDGKKSIDNAVFFARLGQRIIHILTSNMTSGRLYEADMRLRPSGNSGLLVSSLQAFAEYQTSKAWNWEHQALVRARVVAGGETLGQKFAQFRHQILAQPRQEAVLTQEVASMRQKMLENLSSYKDLVLNEQRLTADHVFDLKHDPGGVVDIEFLAQYWVLRWSQQHPELTQWTDNMRILQVVADLNLVAPVQVEKLQQAYLAYRAKMHILALENQPQKLPGNEYLAQRRLVRALWLSEFGR